MTDTQRTSATAGDIDVETAELLRQQKLQRVLKFIVAGLGIAIVVGLAAVIMRIIYMANNPENPASTAILSVSAPWRLEMPQGAKIGSMAISGSTLAVHYTAPGGEGIAIIDLATGKRRAEILPVEAVPKN